MAADAGILIDCLAIPSQPQPGHAVQNAATASGVDARASGILDAQQELAAGMAGIEPMNKAVRAPPICQHSGGRGAQNAGRLLISVMMVIQLAYFGFK